MKAVVVKHDANGKLLSRLSQIHQRVSRIFERASGGEAHVSMEFLDTFGNRMVFKYHKAFKQRLVAGDFAPALYFNQRAGFVFPDFNLMVLDLLKPCYELFFMA